jgi:uncharacterized protein (DUF2225 family)
LKCLLQLGHISEKNVNDRVISLLDRGQNFEEKFKFSEAIANYKVANLLLKQYEDHTETALLIKCLKCLGDVYQSMGNEQEAKKFRRGVANIKKKLKPKKLKVDDTDSVVASVFQPQNNPGS